MATIGRRLSTLQSHLRMADHNNYNADSDVGGGFNKSLSSKLLISNNTATRSPFKGNDSDESSNISKADDAQRLRHDEPPPQSISSQHITPQPSREVAGKPKTAEAAMYSSRQIAAFQPDKPVKKEKTDIIVDNVSYHPVPHLCDLLPDSVTGGRHKNVFVRTKIAGHASPTYNQIIQDNEFVLMDIVRRSGLKTSANAFVRAGPRGEIIWKPEEVVAAIVTCGGLCPGMNDVISELFTTLYYNYGVDQIYGIRNGLRGFWDERCKPWITLTPEKIHGVYELGGSVLGSARGGFDLEKIMRNVVAKDVNQIYIIGGDGTHRAADAIAQEACKRQLKLSVVGIPKTIDNDLGVIDRSFGFSTAVTEARKAIQAAVVEASCAPNGVGIVQLMGRHAGYIAAHATLATRQVDICLIPEIQFPLRGQNGVCELTEYIVKRQGYCVIVIAEGAGADLVAKSAAVYDEGGNRKLPDIGKFLSQEMKTYFSERKVEASIKLIDPSYMIRAVNADASDAVYCQSIAQNAVHGAMAGFTGFSSGLVNNRTVLIPFDLISATSPSYLNPDGRTWERVLSLTHQPMYQPMPTDIQKEMTHHDAAAAAKKSQQKKTDGEKKKEHEQDK